MDKQIFWVASYPKSGNTLLRSILSSIFFSQDGLFNFKLLKNIPIIENTINLDFIKKNHSEDYEKIHKLEILSKYWKMIQSKKNLGFESDFLFVKTHHALINVFNNSFTSDLSTRGIIYTVRDPRDVVISYAHHFNSSIEESVKKLLSTKSALEWEDNKYLFLNKPKPLSFVSSWHHNCQSWIENKFNCPFLLIKYEDMIKEKQKTVQKLVKFFQNNYNFQFQNLDSKIANIVKSTNFKLLKQNEAKFGFSESENRQFFRKGTSDQWQDILNKDQILKIEQNFSTLMKKFGYKTIYHNE